MRKDVFSDACASPTKHYSAERLCTCRYEVSSWQLPVQHTQEFENS